jgi:hypothetical protein
MQTLPLPRLAALLTANAAGYYATEAATRLLIAHGTWLHRVDFLVACVSTWDANSEPLGSWVWHRAEWLRPAHVAAASVQWDRIGAFLDTAPCSGSEARILRLAAELAGYDTATPLDELLSGLDDTNSRLVVAAIAHALNLPQPNQGVEQ